MASKKKSAGLLFDEVLPQAQRTARSLLSLDPQEDVPASQQALEMALGFVPGVGQAMALRDIERARRANDPAAAAMAAASFVPFGRLAGLGKKAGPVMSELDVYHGSPHQFDEFDASKIGTGKGRQRHGYGIYVTESPEQAQSFAESYGKSGNVYKADLPDQMLTKMLDWNKSLNEQPEILKKLEKSEFFRKVMNEGGFSQKDIDSGLMQGRHVLGKSQFGDKAEAEALQKLGIPGVTVKASGNIRNFVVFPGEEKKVKIKKRE